MTLVAAAAVSSAIRPPRSRHSRAPARSQPQSQILFTKKIRCGRFLQTVPNRASKDLLKHPHGTPQQIPFPQAYSTGITLETKLSFKFGRGCAPDPAFQSINLWIKNAKASVGNFVDCHFRRPRHFSKIRVEARSENEFSAVFGARC